MSVLQHKLKSNLSQCVKTITLVQSQPERARVNKKRNTSGSLSGDMMWFLSAIAIKDITAKSANRYPFTNLAHWYFILCHVKSTL